MGIREPFKPLRIVGEIFKGGDIHPIFQKVTFHCGNVAKNIMGEFLRNQSITVLILGAIWALASVVCQSAQIIISKVFTCLAKVILKTPQFQ